MKCTAFIRGAALAVASLGLILPAPLVQAATAPVPSTDRAAPTVPQVMDVGLRKGGLLLGQIVDAQGAPRAKVPVALLEKDRVVVQTATDASGYFAIQRVPAGTYRIVAGGTQGVFRLWAPETAPPTAQPGAMLVMGQGPVRAQQGPLAHWLGNPWVIGGLVATAIAVPVIIHNTQNDEEDTPASP